MEETMKIMLVYPDIPLLTGVPVCLNFISKRPPFRLLASDCRGDSPEALWEKLVDMNVDKLTDKTFYGPISFFKRHGCPKDSVREVVDRCKKLGVKTVRAALFTSEYELYETRPPCPNEGDSRSRLLSKIWSMVTRNIIYVGGMAGAWYVPVRNGISSCKKVRVLNIQYPAVPVQLRILQHYVALRQYSAHKGCAQLLHEWRIYEAGWRAAFFCRR